GHARSPCCAGTNQSNRPELTCRWRIYFTRTTVTAEVAMNKSMGGTASGSGAATRRSAARESGNVPLQPSFSDETDTETSRAADEVTSLKDGVKEAAKTAGRAVKQQASEFASSVGHELNKTAEDQKARGVEAIQCFARAITSAAAELEGQSPAVARSV